VALGGELIARHAHRSDLRLRRQLAALEAVHLEHRVGRQFLQLPPQFVRIVGERFDLLTRQRGRELAGAIAGRLARIAAHRDRILDVLEREHHHLLVVAGAEADVLQLAGLERGELGADVVAAGRQLLQDGDARVARRHRFDGPCLRCVLDADDGDRGAGEDAAARIDHRHRERGHRWRLRPRRCGDQKGQQQAERRAQLHRTTSNFLGSMRGLMRNSSKLVSSMVSAPMARRSRKGNCTSPTFWYSP
jgi:hypothetical protein